MNKIKYLICIFFLANYSFSQVNRTITGTIYSEGIKLAKTKVAVLGTDNYVFTDSLGKYKIYAIKGNILEFSHIGKISKTFTVGFINLINVTLINKKEVIHEVKIIQSGNIKRKKT